MKTKDDVLFLPVRIVSMKKKNKVNLGRSCKHFFIFFFSLKACNKSVYIKRVPLKSFRFKLASHSGATAFSSSQIQCIVQFGLLKSNFAIRGQRSPEVARQ